MMINSPLVEYHRSCLVTFVTVTYCFQTRIFLVISPNQGLVFIGLSSTFPISGLVTTGTAPCLSPLQNMNKICLMFHRSVEDAPLLNSSLTCLSIVCGLFWVEHRETGDTCTDADVENQSQ